MELKHLYFEPLSFRSDAFDPEVGQVFFWSDLHLRHDRDFIYKPRKFESAKQAEEKIIHNLQNKMTANDTLFLMGDTVFGMNGHEYLMSFFKRIEFRELFIMPGNHAAGYKQILLGLGGEFSLPITPNKTVHFIPNYFEVYVNRQAIVMSHYPIVSWNGAAKGAWHLYGHVHNNLKQNLGKAIDLGVENCPEPMSFDDIRRELNKKESVKVDHHGAGDANPFC